MTAIVSRLDNYRRKGAKLLNQWRVWQEAQGLSERTIIDRASTMMQLEKFADTDLLKIEPEHIIAYCARPGLAASTRATYHADMRAFYGWALRVGHIEKDPTIETPRPKRPKNLPRPIFTTQLSVILAQVNRKRTRAMIILAAYAGLRVHEIAKFRGEDIDLLSGIITVTGKGGKTAMIPAHPAIIETAKEFPRKGYWFPAYSAQTDQPHIRSHAVSQAIRDTMTRAGVSAKPHQLRHYYGTELLEQGVDVRIVKDLMRHASLATTEIYTQVSMKQMREGIMRLAA